MIRPAGLAFLALLAPFGGSRAASAADTSCATLFAGARPPAFTNARLGQGVVLLCNDAFMAAASPTTRGALWSAEHLTAASVAAAAVLPRDDEFHPDDRLPPGGRAELADYRGSGFDRGHMAPSGDMPTPAAQAQSFSLANMTPQAPELNRGAWSDIESALRQMAARRGELYVVTGAAFVGQNIRSVGNGVLVPTALWKAVYDPKARAAGAYVCSNNSQPYCITTSLSGLVSGGGIDPFPALPASVRSRTLRLPTAGLGLHQPGARAPGTHARRERSLLDRLLNP